MLSGGELNIRGGIIGDGLTAGKGSSINITGVLSDNNKVPGAKNEIDAVKTEVKTPE